MARATRGFRGRGGRRFSARPREDVYSATEDARPPSAPAEETPDGAMADAYARHILASGSARDLEDAMRADTDDRRHAGLRVSVLEMLDAAPALGMRLLERPDVALGELEEGVRRAQTLLLDSQPADTPCQMRLRPNLHARPVSLPFDHEVCLLRVPLCEAAGRLVAVCGTVVRAGPVRIPEPARVYECARCGARAVSYASDAQYGVVSKPAFPCAAAVDGSRCGGTRYEPAGEDVCFARVDAQEVRLQERTAGAVGALPRSIAVLLRADLVDAVKTGDDACVVGRVLVRWRPLRAGARAEADLALAAASVQPLAGAPVRGPASRLSAGDWAAAFWAGHRDLELRGRDVLVGAFAPEIHGLHLVKLAVLLTVIGGVGFDDASSEAASGSGKPHTATRLGDRETGSARYAGGAAPAVKGTTLPHNDSQNMHNEGSLQARRVRKEGHILLVGDPGTAKSRLLQAAVRVAPRAVFATGSGASSAGLTAAASRDASGDWQLDAGALVLADRGVIALDEFTALRRGDRTAMHEAMEQQTLSVAKAGMVCRLHTRCSVVAACNTRGRFRDGDEPEQDFCTGIALASPLLSRFDLIMLLPDRRDAQWDGALADAVLGAACAPRRHGCHPGGAGLSEGGNEPLGRQADADGDNRISDGPSYTRQTTPGGLVGADEYAQQETSRAAAQQRHAAEQVPADVLRAYVAHVRDAQRPALSPGARTVLARYYQRQRRLDLRDAARTTLRLLESLIRLAQAHAKLLARGAHVLLADAVWAVLLMEASMSGAQPLLAAGRPDVFACAPADPAAQYAAWEAAVLRALEINAEVAAGVPPLVLDDVDRAAEEMLTQFEWVPTPGR